MAGWTAPNHQVIKEYAQRGQARFTKDGKEIPVESVPNEVQILWQSQRRQGMLKFNYIEHPHPKYPKMLMFFSGNEFIWGMWCKDEKGPYLKMSPPSQGRKSAMLKYDHIDKWLIHRWYPNDPVE